MKRIIDNWVIWIMTILCIIPSLIIVPILLLMSRFSGARTYNILLTIDAFWNAVSRGDPFETISARAWRNRDDRRWAVLVWMLDKLQPGHCKIAYQRELARASQLLKTG